MCAVAFCRSAGGCQQDWVCETLPAGEAWHLLNGPGMECGRGPVCGEAAQVFVDLHCAAVWMMQFDWQAGLCLEVPLALCLVWKAHWVWPDARCHVLLAGSIDPACLVGHRSFNEKNYRV